MTREISDVMWISGRDCIGIVKVSTEYNEFQYYIGVGKGVCPDTDATYIADWGTRITSSAMRDFLKNYNLPANRPGLRLATNTETVQNRKERKQRILTIGIWIF